MFSLDGIAAINSVALYRAKCGLDEKTALAFVCDKRVQEEEVRKVFDLVLGNTALPPAARAYLES